MILLPTITAIISRPIYHFNNSCYLKKNQTKQNKTKQCVHCLCVIFIRFFFLISLAAPFLKPINPYIKHWEAAHFDAKIIAAARHQYENKRRKRYANSTSTSHGAIAPTNTIKFQFVAHNR